MPEPKIGLKLTKRAPFQIQCSEHPRSLRQIHKFNAILPFSSLALELDDPEKNAKAAVAVAA